MVITKRKAPAFNDQRAMVISAYGSVACELASCTWGTGGGVDQDEEEGMATADATAKARPVATTTTSSALAAREHGTLDTNGTMECVGQPTGSLDRQLVLPAVASPVPVTPVKMACPCHGRRHDLCPVRPTVLWTDTLGGRRETFNRQVARYAKPCLWLQYVLRMPVCGFNTSCWNGLKRIVTGSIYIIMGRNAPLVNS